MLPSAAAANRVEAEQRAGRHDDLAAMLPGERDQMWARQQGAGAEHHHPLAGGQHRGADVFEDGGRRTFDREIGMVGEFLELHQRALDPGRVEPGLRFRAVARRRAGERESRYSGGKALRERAPDRAEPGNSHPGFVHRSLRHTVRSYAAAGGAGKPVASSRTGAYRPGRARRANLDPARAQVQMRRKPRRNHAQQPVEIRRGRHARPRGSFSGSFCRPPPRPIPPVPSP